MICLTSVSVFPYMGFVSLFSLKGCAQMALTSHHIHLNPGSQLTKQAPQGWRETDSHLLPTPPPRDRAFTRHTTTTKLTARPKNPIHRAYRERRHFSEQHTSRESIIVIASMFLKRPGSLPFRIHAACWWTVIHLWFAKVLQVYSRAAGWGAFQSKAVLTAHMFTFSAAHIDSSI